MNNTLYPMTFTPVYKDYMWGGARILDTYNRDSPPGIYAESWEISDHQDGMSVVSNGSFKGKTFRDVLEIYPQEIMGSNVEGTSFPVLIKILDAKKKLSVQVHPNDEDAAQFGGEAKTEAWHLLGEDETQVYCGLKDGVTKEDFIESVKDRSSGKYIRPVPVKQGSTIFIEGGSVHAIDEGCLILEIQQNSNTTYRISDWGRVDQFGNRRELHIDKALDIINWDFHDNPIVPPKRLVDTDGFVCDELINCPHFVVEKLTLSMPLEIPMEGKSFHALFIEKGSVKISWDNDVLEVNAGTSVLIPAALPHYALEGEAALIRTTVPEPAK